MSLNILLTGAGAPGAHGILRCLKHGFENEVKIIGADIKTQVPTALLIDDFIKIPMPSTENFIPFMLDAVKSNKIDVIIPLVTKELEIFAENRALFEEIGCKISVCDIETLSIANNKRLLLEKLFESDVIVPNYIPVTTANNFEEACKNLGYPKKPICFKPSVANGSRGFRILNKDVDKFDLLFNEKPNSTFASYDEIIDTLKSRDNFPELLVMEYLPGDEYSVDLLANNGEVEVIVCRKRVAMNGGISTSCDISNNQDIVDYCKQIIKALSLDGNIGIQVRKDSNGIFKILEINPRLQGTVVGCVGVGVNFPYLGIQKLLGRKYLPVNQTDNVQMIRHWQEVYFDEKGHAFTF